MRFYWWLLSLLSLSAAGQTSSEAISTTLDSTFYYANGQIDRIDTYNTQGLYVSSKYFREDGTPSEIVQATFVGGPQELYRFIGQNIRYPKGAALNNKMGKVFVRFWIDEAGKVTEPQVVYSPNKFLSQEALRIVNAMPDWVPGTRDGRPHKCIFMLPITFQKI
jgi:TonB family protein